MDESLTGDFFLVMRPCFECANTYVPFRNGYIVTDRTQWRFDSGQQIARTTQNIRRRYKVGRRVVGKVLRKIKGGWLVELQDELLPIHAILRDNSVEANTPKREELIPCEVVAFEGWNIEVKPATA